MNNLSFSLLGLVLIGIPVCLSENTDKQCFSLPTYPCCEGKKVVFTDDKGREWGKENGKWCGIESTSSCFSEAFGYPCCKGNEVVYADESGYWGVENDQWCGIEKDSSNSCFSVALGYSCCQQCEVLFTDESGKWGVENGEWCGIKDSCSSDVVIKADTDFDFAFLKLENSKKNMLYSPLSIKYALQMALEGAEGNTYDEISKVIGNEELTKYSSIDKNLSFANGLYIRDSFYSFVKTSYINLLKKKYDAEVVEDEFKDAENVNKWIEDKTLGIIKDMIKDETVQNPETAMLLINALAMDMEWSSSFDFESTYGQTFQIDNNRNMTATTMYQKTYGNNVSYYLGEDVTVLTMDLKKYNDVQLEFMAIMPNNNDLIGFVENVTKEQINQIDDKLTKASDTQYGVKVYIPKFKFNYDLGLKSDLKNLGIKDAFDKNEANFSKIADPRYLIQKLYISDALHKADIEFTEEGVKAAAVTVIVFGGVGSAAPRPQPPSYPIVVDIDKSFMFIIRDKNTKDIWLTGTVYEPNKWENDKSKYERKYRY